MDIELLEQVLEEESLNLGIDLKALAIKFSEEYLNYFSRSKIFRMNLNRLDTRKDTRLDLTKNPNLSIKEKKVLEFSDLYQFNFNKHSYMIIDIKGMVKEIVINNKKMNMINNKSIYDLTEELKNSFGFNFNIDIYENIKESLYIKSLLYNYAYINIIKKGKIDYERISAGLFKNAYFDIISLYKNILDKKMTL